MNWNDLRELGALGEGSFAVAKLMEYRNSKVAVKLLPRETVISKHNYVKREVRVEGHGCRTPKQCKW